MIFLSKFRLWFFNNHEKNLFQKDSITKKNKKAYFSLIQCPQDELFFNCFKEQIKNEPNSSFGGVNPKLGYPSFYGWILFIPHLLRRIHLLMIRKKWNKIYSSIGIDFFFHSDKLPFVKKISNFWKAFVFFIKLNDKNKLLEHTFKSIQCGELIYDSYIRFNKKPTLSISDPTLILYIQDCYNQICYFENLTSKYKIKNYYTSYSTYIAHGIPVRVFLKNNINVYSYAYFGEKNYNLRVKKLTKSDTAQVKPHWKFKKVFKNLENKNKLYNEGLVKFRKRFSGENDLDFMNINQYDSNYSSPKLEYKFDGVVFIGDFFDSQHVYRKMVFNDLYEWLIYTINISLKYDLNVGFKPHPNQLLGSKKIIDKIKMKYPDVKWIDPKTSNRLIFNSGIGYGISVYGSVIPELAFNKITPICCADNPASDYNFMFEAKTVAEYKDILINPHKFKFKKNLMKQLGEYYYMQNLYKGFNQNK